MSGERLLSCPFCGGEAEHEMFYDGFVRYSRVKCKCGVMLTVPSVVEGGAIKAWNTRKPMERIVERLVDADALLENAEYDEHYRLIVRAESIKNAPTIEAEPVVHGEWIFGTANHREYMKCSECLHTQTLTGVFVYCPNCGAKMDGGDQNEKSSIGNRDAEEM